jgi:hypothetical protein
LNVIWLVIVQFRIFIKVGYVSFDLFLMPLRELDLAVSDILTGLGRGVRKVDLGRHTTMCGSNEGRGRA